MSTFKKLNETNCSILSQESMMQIHGGAFPCECINDSGLVRSTMAASIEDCIIFCNRWLDDDQNSPDYGNNH